jgi:hypothetical protein
MGIKQDYFVKMSGQTHIAGRGAIIRELSVAAKQLIFHWCKIRTQKSKCWDFGGGAV